MTDSEFMQFLHGYCYHAQAGGYATFGVPPDFKPIVPFFQNEDGTINREKTINNLAKFSDAQTKLLLAKPN